MTRGFLYIIAKSGVFFAIYSRYLQCFQHAGEKFPHSGQGIYAHKLPAHLGRVGEIFYPISGGFAAAVDADSLPVKRYVFFYQGLVRFQALFGRMGRRGLPGQFRNYIPKNKRVAHRAAPNHHPGATGLQKLDRILRG